MTTDFDSVDYFTDPSLVPDPHPYFDHLRTKDPVCCPINNGVLAVTGWEAANTVYKDTENYSSCVAVMGPFTPMPFTPEGDDICAQLEEHRTEIPMYEHMVTMDPPHHTDARSLLSPAADAQAAQGERGLHVAAGRPPHRRVHRRRQVRVPRRVRQAVLAAGRRRPARRARGGPRGVPRGVRRPAAGNEHRRPRPRGDRGQPAGVGRREVQPLHRGPPRSRPATTC